MDDWDDEIDDILLTEDSGGGKGCYIATAVYGSYDCPPVWTLRRFRDHYLAEHFLGRLFISCYYRLSPGLVRRFGESSWFNSLFGRLLNRFVSFLKTRGYSDLPYKD